MDPADAADTTFMSKRSSPPGDVGNAFVQVFCDTFLFMLMPRGFCEAGHVARLPRRAYSIRFDVLAMAGVWTHNALNRIEFWLL